ncbi:MAG: DNA internalization-related competence protein ComEC/Rec2 [Sulfuriflexus sp.]|nr:DNA internalization-related competence protein ComEC/Rec2 [Sulfuriflexus sp.]MDT8405396.1 DNA internalization-related competence protein ComEC/Rec2 [Sulfuriflexus sp.]
MNDYTQRRQPPRAGERWRLRVKLKRPHGFLNPGGFDYERYLFRQGIAATGYIKRDDINQKLAGPDAARAMLALRGRISTRIASMLEAHTHAGLLPALAVGDRRGIDAEQWQILMRTGTSHLLAISGLHIGLVAGLVFALVRFLASLSPRLLMSMPAVMPAAIAAMLAAAAYAMLAGFSIPTQRAFIMVSLVMLGILLRRGYMSSSVLALALLVILLYDPLAVLDAGFWLSFGAVAVIMYVLTGRVGQLSRLWQWGRVQWMIALGMLPLMLAIFQQLSLVAPVANLVAVPWVSMVTVPTTLLATLCMPVSSNLASGLLQVAAWSLVELWAVLEPLAGSDYATWFSHVPRSWTLPPALLGITWLLLPRGWPARWAGGVCLLPMLLLPKPGPSADEVWLHLLDVGQGLAVVVRSEQQAMVYDTGPWFSESFDAGRAVIVPFLRAQGIKTLDTLVVSHGDNDHRGGADSLLREIPVRRILSGADRKRWRHARAEPCLAGQAWQWGKVRFEVLSPTDHPLREANNRSCVIRLGIGNTHILLPGDIEAGAERQLLAANPSKLPARLLLVPHHGSKTSSTAAFIRAVNPELALFATGYRNRYRFPHPRVEQRYRDLHVASLNTADAGAITIKLDADGLQQTSVWREQAGRYWHAQ